MIDPKTIRIAVEVADSVSKEFVLQLLDELDAWKKLHETNELCINNMHSERKKLIKVLKAARRLIDIHDDWLPYLNDTVADCSDIKIEEENG